MNDNTIKSTSTLSKSNHMKAARTIKAKTIIINNVKISRSLTLNRQQKFLALNWSELLSRWRRKNSKPTVLFV
ncbi:MAG: hypothetical protein ACR2HT_04995, partial [Pyrinomonadaceae bacterium]